MDLYEKKFFEILDVVMTVDNPVAFNPTAVNYKLFEADRRVAIIGVVRAIVWYARMRRGRRDLYDYTVVLATLEETERNVYRTLGWV